MIYFYNHIKEVNYSYQIAISIKLKSFQNYPKEIWLTFRSALSSPVIEVGWLGFMAKGPL